MRIARMRALEADVVRHLADFGRALARERRRIGA